MTGSGTKPQKESNRAKAPKRSSTTARRTDRPKGSEAPTPNGARAHLSLIQVLAHDLRNPISGILAASQCLLEDAAPFLDRPHVTLLRAIESSSDLMLQLVEDMLEVARADSAGLRLRLRSTDVTKLVEQSLANQQGQAAARDIRLGMTRDPDIPTVGADMPKLGWALNALLANTIRSSESGGEIAVHVSRQRKNVLIVIRHADGEAFARPADASNSGRRWRQQASAIIVSTARLILEHHGGAIRVDRRTAPPMFTLILPRLEAQKGETSPLRRAASGG